jgi:hypothetical protein
MVMAAEVTTTVPCTQRDIYRHRLLLLLRGRIILSLAEHAFLLWLLLVLVLVLPLALRSCG